MAGRNAIGNHFFPDDYSPGGVLHEWVSDQFYEYTGVWDIYHAFQGLLFLLSFCSSFCPLPPAV
jgi:hypothetical protein